jgi:hypothetical protein
MQLHTLFMSVIFSGWTCSRIGAGVCMPASSTGHLTICLGDPTFSCGAAGRNSTVSYRRTVNDHGAIQSDLFLFVMWDVPSQLESYTAGPDDDLIATHVYDVPGTYELRYNLTHGDGAPVGGIATLNCYFEEVNCQIPYYVLVTDDGCSVIDVFNNTVGVENNANEASIDGDANKASGSIRFRVPIFAWSCFTVYVGMFPYIL